MKKLTMEIKHLDDLARDSTLWDTIYYTIYRFYSNLRMIPREIYWFCQRGKRGYADCDVWDFDAYLRPIIIAGLKELKKRAYKSPSKKEYDIMIKGFEANNKMIDLHFDSKSKKYIIEKIKFHKGMQLFAQYFNHLWD